MGFKVMIINFKTYIIISLQLYIFVDNYLFYVNVTLLPFKSVI